MPAIDAVPYMANSMTAVLAPTSTVSLIAQVIVNQQGVTQGVTTIPYEPATVNPGTPTITMVLTSTETSPAAAGSSALSSTPPAAPLPTTSAHAIAPVSASLAAPASPASTPTPLDLIILAASSSSTSAPVVLPTPTTPPAASSSLPYSNPLVSHSPSSAAPVSNTASTPAPTPTSLSTPPAPLSPTGTHTSSSLISSIISPSSERISGIHNSTTSASSTSSASTTSSINQTTSLSTTSTSTTPTSSSSVSTTFTSVTSSETVSTTTTGESTLQTSSYTNVATSSAGVGVVGGGAGAAPTGSSGGGGDSTITPTGPPGNSSESNTSSTPPTPVVVGGVVGGICGVAILCLIVLFMYKWRKRRLLGDQVHQQLEQPRGGTMTERSSETPFAASNTAGFLRRFTASSQQTANSEATTSERGFYKVSGRKIPSVLTSGGDGYGGLRGGDEITNQHVLSGSSFYRDSAGFYGGPASPTSPTNSTGPSREGGVAALRPSPARTPVTSHNPHMPMSASPTSPHPPRHFGSPDGLGRSHPSHDGSYVSRGSRFREDMS